jgi:hypothetical protein
VSVSVYFVPEGKSLNHNLLYAGELQLKEVSLFFIVDGAYEFLKFAFKNLPSMFQPALC